MSKRDLFLRLADKLRSLPAATTASGAPGYDIRPNTVTRRVRTWASGKAGVPRPATLGVDYADVDILLTPTPKVRSLSAREIASSGGRYEDAELVVGPITPTYDTGTATGGYTAEQLDPVVTGGGVEVLYIVEGPNAGQYYLHEVRRDPALRYMLVLGRTRRAQ